MLVSSVIGVIAFDETITPRKGAGIFLSILAIRLVSM
jgi:drug/metabolite transporter (DMT)-like permease